MAEEIEHATEHRRTEFAYAGEVILVREIVTETTMAPDPAPIQYFVHVRLIGGDDPDEQEVLHIAKDDLLALRDLLNAEFPAEVS